jgi:hypothetical protein
MGHPLDIETVNVACRVPSWSPPIPTLIPPTREEALQLEKDNEDDIKIYTDGSGHNSHIGAAAVLFRGFNEPKIVRFHLGPKSKHTVYEGERIRHLLALNLL